MSLPPIYEFFRQRGMRFITNAPDGKFKTNCPGCKELATNFVELDADGLGCRCRCACGFTETKRLGPAGAKPDGGGVPRDDAAEGAPDGSFSHIWRSKDYDYPCTPTGEERRDDGDGRIYARVRTPDGDESFVPKDELIAKDEASFLDAALARLKEKKGLDFADLAQEISAARARGYDDAVRALLALTKPLPPPSLAEGIELALKNNPEGPFSEELLQKFERLAREQLAAFARLCRRYPALAATVRLDAATVRAALENADKDKVVELFIDLVLAADLNAVEIDALTRLAAKKSGIGLRPLGRTLKDAEAEYAARRAKAAKAKRRAERTDPRPIMREPGDCDPWIPVMMEINAVLGASLAPEPPMRDIDGFLTRARKMALPGLHLFSTANEQDADAGSLPAPEQWLLCRMGEIEAAELIERHIDYVDAADKSVHLKTMFVKHYVQRDDDALPIVVAIATLPIVLGDGVLLAPDGLDRKRGIIFKVPKALRDVLPRREGCDEEAVREAMRFLCDDWLCDVATDYAGKCIIIAAALTLIERSLLPERPAFFVTAGKSRGGKTTTLNMLIVAVTGERPAAAAWSSDDNERRKALLGYFLSGVPYILWDNIPRGSQISCSHIEKSCTAAFYQDRRLGVSETVATAAATIHLFTGNNIAPRGDLASRSLQARLAVDRPDPENREFKHPDPIGWTETNRAEILEKLYIILLGNPMLKQPRDAQGRTRFKTWYRLVGSAVEHAARCAGQELDFRKLFLAQEAEGDDDTTALAEALAVMDRRWPVAEFLANDIAKLINNTRDATSEFDNEGLYEMKHDGGILRDLLFPDERSSNFQATARSVGKRLQNHLDEPVQHGDKVLVLRARVVHNTMHFSVSRS